MPLDIHIVGAGFGEMILLLWEEDGERRAALVDGYSPKPNVAPLIRWFRTAGVKRFSFVAVTHPHLDHLFNLDAVLSEFSGCIDYLWFWPGLDQACTINYFNKVAQRFSHSPNELGKRAKAVSALFGEWRYQFFDLQLGKPVMQPVQTLKRIYPGRRQ